MIRAFVPIKRLDVAKSRLAAALNPVDRRNFVNETARHVCRIVEQSVDEISIVTPYPIQELQGFHQAIVREPGLNRSLRFAISKVEHLPGDRTVVILADLPFLETSDIASVVSGAADEFVIAPDLSGTGTNCVAFPATRRPGLFFGANSRERFERFAVRRGKRTLLVKKFGLGFDVDDATSYSDYQSIVSKRESMHEQPPC